MKYKQNISDEELVNEFVSLAIEREKQVLDGDLPKIKRVIYRMFAQDEIFRERGRGVQKLMLPYLQHRNEGVRYWLAKRLLPIASVEARAAIEQVAAGVGPIAADARGTLRELDSGQFRPETLWGPKAQP